MQMNEQKNITFKRSLKWSLSILLVIGFGLVLLAASYRQGTLPVKDIQVHLNEEGPNTFLQKKDIKDLIRNDKNVKMDLTSIDKLDLARIEKIAETNPWVANAEIYIDNRDILQMDITQREPIARIFCADGSGFYIDSTLKEMPVKLGYAFPAPVFTNVRLLRQDSMNKILMQKIASLSKAINKDSFWNAQIEQIEVQPDQTFVLIPLLGNQRIILGDTSGLKNKLDNLFAFYQQVPGKIGWNAYQTLDLRFENQIIAAPSLETPVPKSAFPAETGGLPEIVDQKVEDKTPKMAKPTHSKPVGIKTEPALKSAETTKSVTRTPKPVARSKQKEVKQKKTISEQPATKKEVKPKYIYPGK
jgi:cell division protein FtsQ